MPKDRNLAENSVCKERSNHVTPDVTTLPRPISHRFVRVPEKLLLPLLSSVMFWSLGKVDWLSVPESIPCIVWLARQFKRLTVFSDGAWESPNSFLQTEDLYRIAGRCPDCDSGLLATEKDRSFGWLFQEKRDFSMCHHPVSANRAVPLVLVK